MSLTVYVRTGTPRMADVKAYAAEIGATAEQRPDVPTGEMYVFDLDLIEAETNVWLGCIGMTEVRRRPKKTTVRARHAEYTPEEWDRLVNGRWIEVTDGADVYRCSTETARKEVATIRRAGREVRVLYIGVMERRTR